MRRANQRLRLVDIEFHAIQFTQQIVGKFDIGLVDLIDQEHRPLGALKRFPDRALLDVVRNIMHAGVAEL